MKQCIVGFGNVLNVNIYRQVYNHLHDIRDVWSVISIFKSLNQKHNAICSNAAFEVGRLQPIKATEKIPLNLEFQLFNLG